VINRFDISYPLNIHSRAFLQAILSQSVSGSVGITSSCSLLAFPLSVSIVASTLSLRTVLDYS